MSWQEWLAERPIAVLSTVGRDGMPHAVPVEVVVHEDRTYCWAHATSAKVRNVVREGRAALVAYKGHAFVLVRGSARVLDASDERYADITRRFLDKYQREETYGNDALVEITPERVSSERID